MKTFNPVLEGKTTISRFVSNKIPIGGIKKNIDLYIIFLPVLVYFVVFKYIPMYGVQIAFKSYVPTLGVFGSPWIGLDNFTRFFSSFDFWRLISNTLGISLYHLIAGFPMPILLALMLNEVKNQRYKKLVQTVTYAPHFISEVIMVGMIMLFLSPRTGIVNFMLQALGGQPINFMGEPEWFKTVYVFTGIWQNAGWGSIIYLATLSSVDIQLYEAAMIDGCSKLKRIWYIDIPVILPTATILLIMDFGRIMNVGFQKILLMQNSLNFSASDVIQTYVYRMGLVSGQFSFSAAVGLFNNIVNLILLITVNKIVKKLNGNNLF